MVVVRNDNQNNKALMKQDRPLPLTVFQKIVYLILNKDTHLELLPIYSHAFCLWRPMLLSN